MTRVLKVILDVEKGDTLQKAAAHLHFSLTGRNLKQRLFRLILTKRRQAYYPLLGCCCQTDKTAKSNHRNVVNTVALWDR